LSKILKRKWKQIRKEFKYDIAYECFQNKAFIMMIIETYVASQSRKHIGEIWYLLGRYHREAYNDYCDKLMGKALTGRDEILRNLYFVNRELYDKYVGKIPECYAMGTAYGVALRVLKIQNK
jgi:hypothetical protein